MKRRNGSATLLQARLRATPCGGRNLDPWHLVWGQPYIDAGQLAAAIDCDLGQTPEPDFRTRLLVRDSARAIKSFWGPRKFARWLATSPVGNRIKSILAEDLGRPGFHGIRRRLVASVGLTDLKQVLQLLGAAIHGRVEIDIAGSVSTLVLGLTARPTDDIDLVNEVPAEIRRQRATLQKIKTEYGLNLGHVQAHYLPANWQQRRRSLGDFGGLRAYLVDPADIFVSKLSSKQEKHIQDLRVMAKALDKTSLRRRLLEDGRAFVEDPYMKGQIETNWQFIFQEALFPKSGGESAITSPSPVKLPKAKKSRNAERKKKRPR
jgi:hypothetical protein